MGYLESMYAGFGGEVLWRPENQRWAIDADLFEVKERNFDRLFGLQSYHVLTGHISVFYESPWYNFIFGVHAGQYLAVDRGVTFDITRRFATGVEVGAFFTKTNVSANQFGEGSFDKAASSSKSRWAGLCRSAPRTGLNIRSCARSNAMAASAWTATTPFTNIHGAAAWPR